jgi:PST family polysaccharide transporter
MSKKPIDEPLRTQVEDPDRHFRTEHLNSDLAGRTARGGTIMIVSQALKFITTMVSAAVLARLLTPQDYGLLAMVAVVTNFSYPFRNLGLSAATMQRPDINYGQVSTLFWVNVALSVAMTLITMAVAPLVAWFYGESRLTLITIAVACGFIFSGVTVQHEALLKRQMRFFGLASTEITSMVLGTATAIFLAWHKWGYWALIIGQLAAGASYAAGVWFACGWRPGLPVRNSGVRSMLTFGRNLTGNNILNYIARNVDNLLIGRFWGSRQLGLYSRAYQLLLLPVDQINAPIDGVAVTALSRLLDSPERYRQAYLRMLEKLAMLTMPGMALMIATSDWIVRIVLGPQWDETGQIFALLGIIGLVEPISNTMLWLLISQGRTRELFQWGLIDSVISICSIVAGLRWGAVGVAASYAIIGICLRKPLQFWFVNRTGPVRSADFYRTILPSIYATLSVLAVLFAFRNWEQTLRPLTGLIVSSIIAAALALLCFAVVPRGRMALKDVATLLPLLIKRKSAVFRE